LLTFAPLLFVVLLFPDGRLPSRRWRPVLWLLTGTVLAGAAQLLQAGTNIAGGMTNALSDAGVAYPNPFGVLPRHGWFSGLLGVAFALAVVMLVLVVVSVFVRRRGANAELRQQLAWLGYVGVLTIVVPGALNVSDGQLGRAEQRTTCQSALGAPGTDPVCGRSAGLCGGGAEVPAV
jgi:hypothetical protein